MIPILITFWKLFSSRLQYTLRLWTRSATAAFALGALSDLSRTRADLLAENALLRHQLIVLNRQVKRPALTTVDRIRLGLLARCMRFWRQALLTPSSTDGTGSCNLIPCFAGSENSSGATGGVSRSRGSGRRAPSAVRTRLR